MAHSILIVDDEALTLRTIGRALEAEGYEVLLASSGEEALKTVAEDKPGTCAARCRFAGH